MNVEFIDTNVLIYAHDAKAGRKRINSIELVRRLAKDNAGALSVQVLSEFYAASTRKLAMTSEKAEEIVADFGAWIIHSPAHADLVRAAGLQRRYQINWWDALIVNSAMVLGCSVLWTEDLSHSQIYGSVMVRNPFL
jgi:predicted nucleic acid-binding protein